VSSSRRAGESHHPAVDTTRCQMPCSVPWACTRTTEGAVGDGASRTAVRLTRRSNSVAVKSVLGCADQSDELGRGTQGDE